MGWQMKNISKLFSRIFQVALLSLLAAITSAENLDKQISQLQADVDSIEQDIDALEKNLLFPPLTRIEVYLSLEQGLDFTLRTVNISVDGQEKNFHIYSDGDLAALRLGGLQHFWEGNVALGGHELKAEFEGLDRKGKVHKGSANMRFEKTLTGHSFELKITGSGENKVPTFSIKDWSDK